MRRRSVRVVLVICCVLALPLAGVRADQSRDTIEGTWIMTSAELGGKKLPDQGIKGTKLVLKSGHYQLQIDEGTYEIVPGTPAAMDIVGTNGPNKGKTFLAVFELKGDKLEICYDLEGKTRPTEFKTTPGTKQFLASYERAKD
jgi:uncharacterized protein (TIGR03067 family)